MTFVLVSNAGSMSEAARKLGRSKSTVSAQINSLENKLGVRLFRRNTRKLALSADGEALLETAEEAVSSLLEIEQRLAERRGTFAGQIRIAAPQEIPKAVLAKTALAFSRKHPSVFIELCLSNELQDFVEEDIDIAIRGGIPFGQETVVRNIGEVPFSNCASPAYISERGMPMTKDDLADHHVLELGGLRASRSADRRGVSIRLPISSRAALQSNSLEALLELALMGAGIALLPTYLCARYLESGDLVSVLMDEPPMSSPLSIQFPSKRQSTPAIRSIAEQIRRDLLVSGIAT